MKLPLVAYSLFPSQPVFDLQQLCAIDEYLAPGNPCGCHRQAKKISRCYTVAVYVLKVCLLLAADILPFIATSQLLTFAAVTTNAFLLLLLVELGN